MKLNLVFPSKVDRDIDLQHTLNTVKVSNEIMATSNMNNQYKIDLKTIIVSFSMQPILKNDKKGSQQSIEKLGFVLLNAANSTKNTKHSGALMTIVYIVSTVLDIDSLIDESMIRMSRHPIKGVREFVTKDFWGISQILKDNPTAIQDNEHIYFNSIMPFIKTLGIENIVNEINRPILKKENVK